MDMNWLFFIYQIPAKPTYFRAKIGRRLTKIGSIPVKQAVYVMPDSEQNHEDLGWIEGEIRESGGEAFLVRGELIEGLKDEQVIELFRSTRQNDYREILQAVSDLKSTLSSGELDETSLLTLKSELMKLKKQFEGVSRIDFFPTDEKDQLEMYLDDLEKMICSPPELPAKKAGLDRGKIWVTRKNVYIDRMASAWFIKEFIDPEAVFRFTDKNKCLPEENEIRFDMTEAEYTHQGNLCTFEVLVKTFCPDDPALQQIARIIHDIDLKDDAYGLQETAGIQALMDSIVYRYADDIERIEEAGTILNGLLTVFKTKKK